MYALFDLQNCPALLKDFLVYLRTIKGLSEKTIDAYYIDLRFFLRFLYATRHNIEKNEKNLSNISLINLTTVEICSATLSDAYEFLNFVQSENNNNAKTRSRKTSAIRSFYKYIFTKTYYLKDNPMQNLEVPSVRKSVPKYLTLEESISLINAVTPGKNYERDYCIITLLLNCGMRLSELVNIKIEDIKDNTLKLLGKGNKERIIYLNDACLFAIEQYKSVRTDPLDEVNKHYLLLSSRGGPLTNRRVEQIVEFYLNKAGLSGRGYSPHKLRHTAATLLYQYGGVDIRVLKEILGHANIGTTEIYTHVANEQLENAASKSPLSDVKPK